MPFRLTITPGFADGWSVRPSIVVSRSRPVDLAPALVGVETADGRIDVHTADAVARVSLGRARQIPFELTKEFAAAHPNVTVVETAAAPHGWEANVGPERFQSALTSWFTSPNLTSTS